MPVRLLNSYAELEEIVPAWEDLANSALERNVFYEPWMLLPAIKYLTQSPVSIVVVSSDGSHSSNGNGVSKLIGLFPIVSRVGYRRLPIRCITLWQHLHCFLSTPLVRLGYETECLENFFEWLDEVQISGSIMEFSQIAGDGPFYELLKSYTSKNRRSVDEFGTHQRALMCTGLEPEAYIENALSGKRRKEIRRKTKRLAELGQIRSEVLKSEDNIESWLETFLEIEASGWKGERGTAIANSDGQKAFFSTAVKTAHSRGNLLMQKLLVNDLTISMQCSFISGEGSFLFKIAYDENYANYSPGVLLELENIAHVLTKTDLKWMDSCAIADHFMINRLFTERRTITNLAVDSRSLFSQFVVSAAPRARNVYRYLFDRRVSNEPAISD